MKLKHPDVIAKTDVKILSDFYWAGRPSFIQLKPEMSKPSTNKLFMYIEIQHLQKN